MADDRQSAPENQDELILTADDQVQADVNDGSEEEVPTFGGSDEPQPDDTNLVAHLREQIRERDRKLAEAKRPTEAAVDPGPEPTLEDCEYDEDKLKLALRDWDKKVAAAKEPEVQANAQVQQRYQQERNRYLEGKAKLGYADVDAAEETVKAALTPEQQSVLVLSTDDPAKMMYALYKNPAKLAELAQEQDFFKLAARAAKMEGQLKMVKRRRAPDPEQIERGSARISHQNPDKQLEKLEAEAEKTGDRSKIAAYLSERRKAK